MAELHVDRVPGRGSHSNEVSKTSKVLDYKDQLWHTGHARWRSSLQRGSPPPPPMTDPAGLSPIGHDLSDSRTGIRAAAWTRSRSSSGTGRDARLSSIQPTRTRGHVETRSGSGERGQGRRLAALPHVKTNKAHGSARRERRDRVPAVGEANRMQPRPASGFSFRWAVLDGRRHPLKPAAARALRERGAGLKQLTPHMVHATSFDSIAFVAARTTRHLRGGRQYANDSAIRVQTPDGPDAGRRTACH